MLRDRVCRSKAGFIMQTQAAAAAAKLVQYCFVICSLLCAATNFLRIQKCVIHYMAPSVYVICLK